MAKLAKNLTLSAVILIIGGFLILGPNLTSSAQENGGEQTAFPENSYVPGELILKLKSPVADQMPSQNTFGASSVKFNSLAKINQTVGATKFEKMYVTSGPGAEITRPKIKTEADKNGLQDFYVVKFDSGQNMEEAVSNYQDSPLVASAAPNFVYHATLTPNDTEYGEQWGLHNTGQSVNGYAGDADDDIDAPEAWDENFGSSSHIIAIIDTGMGLSHEDFAGKLASTGWDFINNDNDATDDNGHGTFVGGIAAARSNNGKGIAGVSWQAKLLPLKVLAWNGYGTTADVASAIVYAVNHGASILNLSLSTNPGVCDSSLDSSINTAFNAGALIIAAAGNDDTDTDPPANRLSLSCNDNGANQVIAVANTNQDDQKYEGGSGSNYGADTVDISAPGVNVKSLRITCPSCYGFWGNGTSYSAPHVAGAASLLKANFPSWTNVQLRDRLIYAGDDLDTENPAYAGELGERLNIDRAMNLDHPDGSILKLGDANTYYRLVAGVLQPYGSSQVISAEKENMSDALIMGNEELDSLSVGSNRLFPDGTIVKGDQSNTVWMISNQQKRGFASWAVFTGLGYQGSDIRVVNEHLLTPHATGANITSTASHPTGSLIQATGDNSVYYINALGQKQPFNSSKVFNAQFYGSMVAIVTPTERDSYANGSTVIFPEGTLLKQYGTNTIWVVSNTTRRAFGNYPIFRIMGYEGKPIIDVYEHELNLHTSGATITE